MSDFNISIVPRITTVPEHEQKAKQIFDWLVTRNIIKPEPSDCVLHSNAGYAIAEGARLVCSEPAKLPFHLRWNGLDVVTERQVFDPGENGLEEMICPDCQEDISGEDWNFFIDWPEQDNDDIICPLCNHTSNIHNFKFSPEWGFSNLGFRFSNWPDAFTEEFITEFRDRIGCEISIIKEQV